MKLYKDYTGEPYSVSVNPTTLPLGKRLAFTKNLL